MDLDMDQTEGSRVEVSGWDAAENFFVEKTVLDWRREENSEISLRCSLREGCMVFVRLLQPLADVQTFPVPYQAVQVAMGDSHGRTRARLVRLRPRTSVSNASSIRDRSIDHVT